MTEEEKKAIKYLKNEIERVNKENNFKKMPKEIVCIPLFLTYSETLLNLIEKLQKENEKLRVQGSIVYLDYKILKDKIRELLEKLNLKLDKLKQEMDKEYNMYGKSSFYLYLDEQWDYLYEIKELLEEG